MIFQTVLKVGLPVCAISLTFFDKFAYVAPVGGVSMQPLINPQANATRDMLLLSRLPIKFNKIQRGDVVAVVSPKDKKEVLLKRVIGLPGDVIKTVSHKSQFVEVPEGHCWIEGDNHGQSFDSNAFGTIPMGLLVAKATFIIWPINRLQKIQTELPTCRILIPLKVKKNRYRDQLIESLHENSNGMEHFNNNNNNVNFYVDYIM